MFSSSDLPIHPRTGRQAVGIVNGKPVWPILGGSEPPEPPEPPKPPEPPAYTPPASQADLDRIVEQRLARERAKYSDYDELKTKAARADELENTLASDSEKAVKAAREEERAKALNETRPQAVRSEFKAAAKGVLSAEQLTALLEDLDLSKYIDDKGQVDEDKIEKKVKAFAPADDGKGDKNGGGKPRTLGQGQQKQSTLSARDRGAAEAAKRFKKDAAAS